MKSGIIPGDALMQYGVNDVMDSILLREFVERLTGVWAYNNELWC